MSCTQAPITVNLKHFHMNRTNYTSYMISVKISLPFNGSALTFKEQLDITDAIIVRNNINFHP